MRAFIETAEALPVGYRPVDLHARLKASTSETAGVGGADFRADVTSWLPYAAEKLRISPNLSDYVVVPTVIMPTNLPNRNGVAFPYSELTNWSTEEGMVAYKSWRGMPTHLEHCFPADAPVLTSEGFKPIKRVKVGDLVWTHEGRFKPVVRKYRNGRKSLSKIRVQGIGGTIKTTANHPLWVVDKRQIFGKVGYGGGRNPNLLRDDKDFNTVQPHFRVAADVYTGDYLVVPLSIGGKIKVDEHFAFLVGVYAAEGSLNKDTYRDNRPYSATLTIGSHEQEFATKIVKCAEYLGYKYTHTKTPERGTQYVTIRNAEFAKYVREKVGEYSHLKSLKGEIRKWNRVAIKQFLAGYISGDGCDSGGVQLRCRTASYALARDIQVCLGRIGIYSNVTKDDPGGAKQINKSYGIYLSKGSYCVNSKSPELATLNNLLCGKSFAGGEAEAKRVILLDKWLLVPILEVEHDACKERVYNLEVEEDNSYTAYNVVVHNCNQDPTIAKGVIFDTALRPLRGVQGNFWKVVALCGFDRTKDSHLVNEILAKRRNCYSMGARVGSYTCSVCDHNFTEHASGCEHLDHPKNRVSKLPYTLHGRDNRLAYYVVHDIKGFEVSSVAQPAYVSAETTEYINMLRG